MTTISMRLRLLMAVGPLVGSGRPSSVYGGAVRRVKNGVAKNLEVLCSWRYNHRQGGKREAEARKHFHGFLDSAARRTHIRGTLRERSNGLGKNSERYAA